MSVNIEQRIEESAEGQAVTELIDCSSTPLARGAQSTTDSSIISQSTNEVPFNTLFDNGYNVIPVEHAGKRPIGTGWQNRTESSEAERAQWTSNGYSAGIITKQTPAVDIDVRDEKVALMVQEYTLELLGVAPIRIGQYPKRLLACRADIPFKKMVSKKYKSPNGDMHQIEFLGDGQQFVSHGIHSGTGKPYYYLNKDLANTPSSELPFLSPRLAEKIIAYFESIVPDDWEVVSNGKKQKPTSKSSGTPKVNFRNSILPPDSDRLKNALAVIPADDYDKWCHTGISIHNEYQGSEEGFVIWFEWSRKSSSFKSEFDCRKRWNSFNKNPCTKNNQRSVGTIFYMADQYGWDKHENDFQYIPNNPVIVVVDNNVCIGEAK